MQTKKNLTEQASFFMPDDQYSAEILLKRANQLAQQADIVEDKVTINFIRFRLGNNEHYGISYQTIQEVIDDLTITKLPYVNECIAGIINYRGALLTILDLNQFFHIPKDDTNLKKYVIVVNIKNISVGLLVDDIEGIDAYEKEKLNNNIAYHGIINTRYLYGIHQGNTTILNIETILPDLQLLLNEK